MKYGMKLKNIFKKRDGSPIPLFLATTFSFFIFFLLQINSIIDKTRSNASTTANTIIAPKDANISDDIAAAPTNSPITNARATAIITVIIPKHLLLLHLSSFLS